MATTIRSKSKSARDEACFCSMRGNGVLMSISSELRSIIEKGGGRPGGSLSGGCPMSDFSVAMRKVVLAERIAASTVAAVHVYFPDPWWKRRHKKRRVFDESFVAARPADFDDRAACCIFGRMSVNTSMWRPNWSRKTRRLARR